MQKRLAIGRGVKILDQKNRGGCGLRVNYMKRGSTAQRNREQPPIEIVCRDVIITS